jgi:hypothetical protein
MQKGSPIMLAAIIIMAMGGLVMVNIFQEKNQPKTEAQMQAEQEKLQAEEEKKRATQATPAPPHEGSESDLVLQEGELKLGDPKGEHEMILAYEWTPEVQSDPTKLSNIISKMKTMPKIRARVINVDENESMAPGLYMDGKLVNANPLMPGAESEIMRNLQQMIRN